MMEMNIKWQYSPIYTSHLIVYALIGLTCMHRHLQCFVGVILNQWTMYRRLIQPLQRVLRVRQLDSRLKANSHL